MAWEALLLIVIIQSVINQSMCFISMWLVAVVYVVRLTHVPDKTDNEQEIRSVERG